MSKTHLKDTIGKAVLCVGLVLVGETLFSYGLFWPVLLALMLVTRRTYFLGLVLGILLSVATGTLLGLASLVIVVALFTFERCRGWLLDNVWLMSLTAALFGLVMDKVVGLSWSVFEGLVVFGLTLLFWKLGYFADEVHLSR